MKKNCMRDIKYGELENQNFFAHFRRKIDEL